MSVQWEVKGQEFGNCNCSYGCPCQFNGLPSYGDCKAVTFFRIDEGYFGDVRLDGLKSGFIVAWPGPPHEGGGRYQVFIDESATEEQRDALFQIMTGKHTDDFATMWNVFASVSDEIFDPIFTKIEFSADQEGRTAACRAEGLAEGKGEPILNPVTGAPHRARINLPNGFEYHLAEVGRGWSSSQGKVSMELSDSYAQWCKIHLNQNGVIAN